MDTLLQTIEELMASRRNIIDVANNNLRDQKRLGYSTDQTTERLKTYHRQLEDLAAIKRKLQELKAGE